MIQTSECVLRGHPDKFCDQVADRVLLEAYRLDPRAYGQIEVAAWSDHVFLTGSTATREPLEIDLPTSSARLAMRSATRRATRSMPIATRSTTTCAGSSVIHASGRTMSTISPL